MKNAFYAFSCLFALLACLATNTGCDRRQEKNETKRLAAFEAIEAQMKQFASSNKAILLTSAPTNWSIALTSDIEDSLKKDGKPIAVEVIVPDVRHEEAGTLLLDAASTMSSIENIRIEAYVTTNMLGQIRMARSQLSSLWLVMMVESVQKLPLANDNEEIVLRGRAVTVESRPEREWFNHIKAAPEEVSQ